MVRENDCYLQKSFSILLIFCILPYLTGCYSIKTISNSEMMECDAVKFSFAVQGQNLNYLLDKAVINDDILYGTIIKIKRNDKKYYGNIIQLYLFSDSSFKKDQSKNIRVPITEINRIDLQEINRGKTSLAVVGWGALAFLIGLNIWARLPGTGM